jgi:protein-L-isoaspartate(D-aspartate) O-methyltransferase
MLQAIGLKEDETVLEVGTGSGFVTACLSRLARHVVSVDIHRELMADAKSRLADHGGDNVELFHGDVMRGWQPELAHDVVVVTGSVPNIPEIFRGWVNPGGRLFVITGESPAMQAMRLTRIGVSEWQEESLFETDLIRLENSEPVAGFEF